MQRGRHTAGRARRRAGATIVEIAVSSTLLLATAGATIQAIADMRGAATLTTTTSKLSEQGERALARIIADLRRSGFATVGGLSYPHLYLDGDAGLGFDHHDYDSATQFLAPSDPDYVTPRSIVFLQPADSDAPGTPGAGRPDVDANGQLLWDTSEFSYVVVSVNGRNQLQRRTDAGSPVVIASEVEWIRFDDAATPGVNVPANALQVRLALRAVDPGGREVRWFGEAVVRLRNG
jgi:hypothetical protein